ncbi:MAG TPA: universal stress protein [Phycicoccus sp.]|nr:universal stress protein [Phycicoccus sp.]HQY95875.1 universal stress protein [Phycicoccus sp.]HRA45773.1 universal stress protein [Phycicoccus sp.]
MTVIVAHQASKISERVLAEALREAKMRETDLVVLNITDSLDLDKQEALQVGIGDVVTKVGADSGVDWTVELVAGASDVAERILGAIDSHGAELLVIGARHRSPMGKALLGSITQTLLLEASVPVLVVKR